MSSHQSTNGAAKQPARRQKCDAVAQKFRSKGPYVAALQTPSFIA